MKNSKIHQFYKKPIYLCLILAFSPISYAEEITLEEITVSNKRVGDKPILSDEVVATESLSARDIEKTGATTLTEALDKRPGISLQTECSICNVRNIVLNNLPGRYTTLLIDGIPIFSSVSAAYGLDSVNLGGIERIDVARGAGASLIAPEALAGSVNIVSRRPKQNEFIARQQVGEYGMAQTSLFGARALDGGAITGNFDYNTHNTVDGNGDKISEYTGYHRFLGGLGFFADDIASFKIRGRVDLVDEKRMGGASGDNYSRVKADGTGNPFNFSKGPNGSPDPRGWVVADGSGPDTLSNGQNGLFYNDGRAGFSEIIFTNRYSAIASGVRPLGDGTLKLAFGYANHKQDSFYEKALYKAEQNQYYLEASTQQPLGDTLVTAGLNYRYEDLNSTGARADGTINNGIDNYVYKVPGLFLQAYRAMFDDKLEVNGSVRFDKHNVFGTITSPRLNVLWNHEKYLSSRISLGKGFRAPTSFFEQDHGILDTGAIVRLVDKPEVSYNASYALAYSADRLSFVASANYNKIENAALLDPGQFDALGNPITLFTSAKNPFTVKGVDLNLTYKITSNLEGTLGLEKTKFQFDPGVLIFARPEERVYLRADYNQGPLDIFVRSTWTGRQDLAKFGDYANNQRYNFDGTEKANKSPSFWVTDARAEYRANKSWSGYVGVDNVFDYKQTDTDSFLFVDAAGSPDVINIWGPNRGRFIYAGLRFEL